MWGCESSPTVKHISDATVSRDDQGIRLSWSAATPGAYAGFNIYRYETAEEKFIQLNREMLTDPGHSYTYLDEDASAADVFYRIDGVTADGKELPLLVLSTVDEGTPTSVEVQ